MGDFVFVIVPFRKTSCTVIPINYHLMILSRKSGVPTLKADRYQIHGEHTAGLTQVIGFTPYPYP